MNVESDDDMDGDVEFIGAPSSPPSDITPARVVSLEDDSVSDITPRERPASLVTRVAVIEAEKLICRNGLEGAEAIEPKEEGTPARKRQKEEIAKIGKDAKDQLSLGELLECILMDGEEKITAEKITRSDFTGLCLDLNDRRRAEALKADSQEEWIAYTNDQAEFSDFWVQTLVEIQKTIPIR